MRVALLNCAFWPEVRRGSERFVHDLATELIAAGQAPRLITSHPGPPRRSTEDGLPITRHWRPPGRMLDLRGFQPYLTHVPLSYGSLVAGDDDIAHALFPTDALAAVRWRERTGRPAVFSYMGLPERATLSYRRLRLRILDRVTRGSDAVLVLSRAAQEGMWRWLGVESHLIHPGVRLDDFTPASARAPEPTIACAASPEDPRKRVDLLVRAFAHVRRERPAARLVLMRPQDPAVAERLTAESAGVVLVDSPPVSLAEVFATSWVTALTSSAEAFGLVVVESLACGTPVVAADDAGPAEIIDRPEIGRLFGGDDERAVARALLEALELAGDPTTAGACRRRAEDFSSVVCGQRHLALYGELIGSR